MRRAILLLLVLNLWGAARAAAPGQSAAQKQAPASPTPETQQVAAPNTSQTSARVDTAGAGGIDPAEVKALAHKIWLAEYRVNDLLSAARPERWKMSDAARDSFQKSRATLQDGLRTLEDWRSQFEKRTDRMYLGYETYGAITTVLPSLDSVGRSISEYENPSFGAQYGQAAKQLWELQRSLGAYLGLLVRNQDQVLQALENNVAGCQTTLTYAMRPKVTAAKPMRNERAGRPSARRSPRSKATAGTGVSRQKATKKAESKQPAAKKQGTPAPPKPGQKKR